MGIKDLVFFKGHYRRSAGLRPGVLARHLDRAGSETGAPMAVMRGARSLSDRPNLLAISAGMGISRARPQNE